VAVVALGSTGCGSTFSFPPSARSAERLESGRRRPEPLVSAVADVSARCRGTKPGRDEMDPRCLTDACWFKTYQSQSRSD
jgi:hypothetical protein